MSAHDSLTDVEQLDRRIEALSGWVPDDHLEALQQERAELTGDADPSDDESVAEDVDVVEALSEYDDDVLGDRDAIDAEVEALERKLEQLGTVLPRSRVAAVEEEIEALQAVRGVVRTYGRNNVEALAARLEAKE